MMSKLYGDEYGKVVWRAEDVKSINGAWSLPRCEEWLEDNNFPELKEKFVRYLDNKEKDEYEKNKEYKYDYKENNEEKR